MSNETKTVTAQAQISAPLTSQKLEELQTARKVAMKAQAQLVVDDKIDSPEFETAATEVLSINSEITKEKSRLIKEANDQKAAELRKDVVADFDILLSLRDAATAKNATDESKTAWDNAKEAHINVLLGTVPKPKADGTGVAKSGSKKEQILAMALAGNTYGQMIAAGMGDGTIRTELTKSTGWTKVGSGNDATYQRIS